MASTCTIPLAQRPMFHHDISNSNISAAGQRLREVLDSTAVITDVDECHRRSSNAWVPALPEQRPAVVVQPETTEQVSQILRICSSLRIPVTSFSGGTSLSGAIIATRGGICVDFARMNKILSVNSADMDAIVQPGVGWQQLNDRLNQDDFFFPPDPSPDACVGGMIAMSCAGTNAYRYGTMKEWVIALTVVLADGTIIRTRRRPRKSSAGYDLTHLMIGSEGTLGLVTEAILKITAVPKNLHVAVATFPDCHAAVHAGVTLAQKGYPIDALELLCERSIKAINVSGLSPKRKWAERPTLFLKLSGSQRTVDDLIAVCQKVAEENGSTDYESAGDTEQVKVLWGARKIDGKATVMMKKDDSDIFIPSDAAVTISRVADLIEFSYQKLDEAEMIGSVTAHLGDGNLHVKIICEKDREKVGRGIIEAIEYEAVRMDGTVTGEHGIGLKLRDALVEELGETAVDMMRKIKFSLDPLCILNCDKVMRMDPA